MFSHFRCIQILCFTRHTNNQQPKQPRHSKVIPNIHQFFETMWNLNWSATFSFRKYLLHFWFELYSFVADGCVWPQILSIATKIDMRNVVQINRAVDHHWRECIDSVNAEMDILALELCIWIFGCLDSRESHRRFVRLDVLCVCVFVCVCVA